MAELLGMTQKVKSFIDEKMSRESAAQRALRAETFAVPHSGMMSRPETDAFLQVLIRLTGAHRVLEIGTFTGSGALAMALSLPEDGRVIACDVSADWTAIGRKYWQQAGVAHKIDLRLAPAAETIAALLKDGQADGFDMAFIDADKTGYRAYYERLLRLIRPGGLIAVDNTIALAGGPIFSDGSANAAALLELNEFLRDDGRVDHAMLSVGERLTLLRKR